MVELESILEAVSKGKMNVDKAKILIEKNYALKKQKKRFLFRKFIYTSSKPEGRNTRRFENGF